MAEANVGIAFLLTILAGLSTGIGSAIAFFAKKTNEKFLSVSLGFSAGVMIYVSFVEIFTKAKEALTAELGYHNGYLVTTLSFFGGMAVVALIDKLVPEFENPHEASKVEDMCEIDDLECRLKEMEEVEGSDHLPKDHPKNKKALYRMGMLSALAIAIHNFPEGLATFTSALKDPSLGVTIAIAIAIHNIPEGIAVSVPLYYATGSKKKAFGYSFLSGLAEPFGALIGYFIFFKYFNDTVYGILFAAVAGIMVFISLDQLLPAAERYGEHHLSIYGLISGMIVMAGSLILFS